MVRCLPTRVRPSELDTCCTAPSKGIDRLTAAFSDCGLFWPYWRPAGQLLKNPFGYRNHPESEGRTGPIPRFLVNLSLSSLTGLADGLALKDRATQRSRCDSPQLLVPPISPSVWRRFSGFARGTVARLRTPSVDHSGGRPRSL